MDWKNNIQKKIGFFIRKKLPKWQEAYIDKLNKEYIELLKEDKNPSEKFWCLEKRIQKDKKKKGVQVKMGRSELIYHIVSLIYEEAISLEDLEEFSDNLKETVHFILQLNDYEIRFHTVK